MNLPDHLAHPAGIAAKFADRLGAEIERVRDEIQSYMDMDTWRRALDVESVEKKSMQDFHAEWLRRLGR